MPTTPGYYTQERKEMAAFLPEAYSRVLDIGCGEGDFSVNLRPVCEIWGVEPSPPAAEAASQRMRKVLLGKYEEVADQLPDDYFDLVVCNDVIEHMADHDAFFDAIKKKMTRDGCLVGSIPNVRYYYNLIDLLLKRDWKYVDAGVLDGTHLRFFTEVSLKRTLEDHGFSIEKFEGINRVSFGRHSLKNTLRRAVVYGALAVSRGAYKDILFLEFAFRARRPLFPRESAQGHQHCPS